jgi:O-antigen ligase
VLLGALLMDAGRLLSFRPRLIDIPMAVWCVVPLATSLSNGLGLHDGLSGCLDHAILWGVPYIFGRLYFNDLASLRDLAIAVVIGGIVYMPLCLWEVRMSPQLHVWFYGFRQHQWDQVLRFGGYRPMVFMQHGLAVGMFMATAALLALQLWRSGTVRQIRGAPIALVAGALLVTAVLCKSAYAILLGFIGAVVLWLSRATRAPVFVVALLMVPPVYMVGRTLAGFTGEPLVEFAEMIDADRALSLQTRLTSENLLWNRAAARPILGWGGGGRQMVTDETGKMTAIPDGMWIIALGRHGWIGLLAMTGTLLLPAAMFLRRWKPRLWAQGIVGPAAGLAVVLVLFMCDNLMNAMFNPMYLLAAGGLAGLATPAVVAARQAVQRRAPGRSMPAMGGAR